jgi:hypothetical protein
VQVQPRGTYHYHQHKCATKLFRCAPARIGEASDRHGFPWLLFRASWSPRQRFEPGTPTADRNASVRLPKTQHGAGAARRGHTRNHARRAGDLLARPLSVHVTDRPTRNAGARPVSRSIPPFATAEPTWIRGHGVAGEGGSPPGASASRRLLMISRPRGPRREPRQHPAPRLDRRMRIARYFAGVPGPESQRFCARAALLPWAKFTSRPFSSFLWSRVFVGRLQLQDASGKSSSRP